MHPRRPRSDGRAVARRQEVRASRGAGEGRGALHRWAGGGGLRWLFRGSVRAAAMQPKEAGGGKEGEKEGGESQRRVSQRAGAAPPGWHRGLERSGARGSEGTSAGACGPGLRGASGPGRGGAGRASRQPQVVSAKSFAVLLPGRLESILDSDSSLVLGHPQFALSFLEH